MFSVARNTFFLLCWARYWQQFLVDADLVTVIQVFVSSSLDYCNPFYMGLPLWTSQKLTCRMLLNAYEVVLATMEHITAGQSQLMLTRYRITKSTGYLLQCAIQSIILIYRFNMTKFLAIQEIP